MTDDFNPTEWITAKEAAELTGYDAAHIRRLIGGGRLPAVKRGGAWFLSKEKVLAYAEEMQQLGSTKHDPWRAGARQKTTES
jgi:excisionase family DNA binding protein